MCARLSKDPPYSYDEISLYNGMQSPSTIHVKNTAIRAYFFKYLFQKAISVFKWDIPEEWDKDYFLYTLYGTGYIAVLYTDKYGTICQRGTLGGYNLYRKPSYCIITNELLDKTITANIANSVGSLETIKGDTTCAIIKLQPDYSPIIDIVGYYADQLALCAESLGINILNIKSGTVFGAINNQMAEAYKKMFDKLSAGEPAVVIDRKLLDEQGKPTWFPFTQHIKESYVVSDLLSDMRKIECMFDTEIGIPNANTDKRERLIETEVNSNNVETATRCELWLEEIRKGLTIANNLFNLKLSVDWRVKPETREGGTETNE